MEISSIHHHIVSCDTTRDEMQEIVDTIRKHLYNSDKEERDFEGEVLGYPVYVNFTGHNESLNLKEVAVCDKEWHYEMSRDSFVLKCILEDTIIPSFTKYCIDSKRQQEQIREDQSLTQYAMGFYSY